MMDSKETIIVPRENTMNLYFKNAAFLSLLVTGYMFGKDIPQNRADLQREITQIEDQLKNIRMEREKATAIDPTFYDDFDREIRDKQTRLQLLKNNLGFAK
jgi:uncharacterized protein YeeX (DUF496 family)